MGLHDDWREYNYSLGGYEQVLVTDFWGCLTPLTV